MLNVIKQLILLLDKKQRIGLLKLQMISLIMAVLEILSVLLIWQLMTMAINPNIIADKNYLYYFYQLSGVDTQADFIILFSVVMLFVLLVNTIFSSFGLRFSAYFSTKLGFDFGSRLYHYYLSQPYLYHTTHNSAELMNKTMSQVNRTTHSVINMIIITNVKLILIVLMSVMLLSVNLKVTVMMIGTLSIVYVLIYKLIKIRLDNNGIIITAQNKKRYQLISEGLGGIKDLLLLNRFNHYIKQVYTNSNKLGNSTASNIFLSQIPRYLIELVALGSLVLVIAYLFINSTNNVVATLPLLTMYATAAFKLLPAFQQVYLNTSVIKGNISAFHDIKDDLINSKQMLNNPPTPTTPIELKHQITLKDITFAYPNQKKTTLKKINLTIPIHSSVAFVGASGAGKSTLLDILLGLILTKQGGVFIDNQPVDANNVSTWQRYLGYVPQTIFLKDGTIVGNIAFGTDEDKIDYVQVDRCIKMAHLEKLVAESKNGIKTMIGERGVQLSGGQRQRIGIARALYHDPQVLVMDEATNALDGLTEKAIINTIDAFSHKKTIITIAHRMKTIQHCDTIYLMSDGEIIDYGSYDALIKRNKHFQQIADLS